MIALWLACAAPDVPNQGPVSVYFNNPGSNLDTVWESDAVRLMIDLIDQADASVDMAVMGFSHEPLVDAVIRAYDRGVPVRMVGDGGHIDNAGYTALYDRDVPLRVGNSAHIMHDKFVVVDGRFVFTGTANWTDSDLQQNSNNFVFLDSPPVAADFTAEFDQMWNGAYGQDKVTLDNGRTYPVGDANVEVWFSPNEDAMGRILELVDGAKTSVRFAIFAFTKDQLGSALVRQHEALGGSVAEGTGVAGVMDQSQMHSNGQFTEVYRLLRSEVPLRLDGNDATTQPGDYQAGGGRLHAKTIILDAEGEEPILITGSFNWSASATQSNDETLLVVHDREAARLATAWWESLWFNGRVPGDQPDAPEILAGDVVINEVHWYGVTPDDPEGFDEFIELKNTTDRDLVLDLWQVSSPFDTVVGLPPGTVLPAGDTLLVADHVLEAYQDGAPQDATSALTTADLVINPFNDDRGLRLYLEDHALELSLLDPQANVIDVAGDGGPPFAGGPDGNAARSMERIDPSAPGDDPANWASCPLTSGEGSIREDWRDLILATPDTDNASL